MTRRVLVTGGAGFIGSHAAEAFLAAGDAVTVLDDLSSGARANVPAGAQFREHDIGSDDAARAVREGGFTLIAH
ncbi:MAG TPA: NAD-dependent epimerase/dehydratase family protein, partial [Dongiaceae bacterium]|nr:NAD-dependent epimerase/dehydratase family protein [Dongiaceae bacterium]